jgi:hypothetical protein
VTPTDPDPWALGWDAVGALGTAFAALVALMIWLIDGRNRMRTRARGIVSSVHELEWGTEAIVANHSELPAFDVRVERADGMAQPLVYAVLHPGQRETVEAAEHMIRAGRVDDAGQRITFTMDGRRWRADENGKLSRVWR